MTNDLDSTSALALRTTVRELVSTWQAAEQSIRTAFAQIAAAETSLNNAFTLGGSVSLHVRGRYGRGDIDFSDAADSIEALARTCWGHIVDRLELRRVLSDVKWRELEEHLRRGELLEITEANVIAFAAQYMSALPELFAEKVTESFEWIRPRQDTPRADYKTNQKNATYEIGEKIVLTSVVGRGWSGGFSVGSYAQGKLSALESVFRALDGQGYGTKHHYSDLETAVNASKDGRAVTDYFDARVFKNGNMHLTFKRADLLARFNQIAGGQRLRAAS
jgi:hypothetical protein